MLNYMINCLDGGRKTGGSGSLFQLLVFDMLKHAVNLCSSQPNELKITV